MTVKPFTQKINTDEITVMSHVTSITVTGNKISKLQADNNSSTIHLSFDVTDKKDEQCILSGAKELGLILQATDALELGLMLTAMGIKNQSPEEVAKIQARLYAIIEELNTVTDS
jgi:hypothetical protein